MTNETAPAAPAAHTSTTIFGRIVGKEALGDRVLVLSVEAPAAPEHRARVHAYITVQKNGAEPYTKFFFRSRYATTRSIARLLLRAADEAEALEKVEQRRAARDDGTGTRRPGQPPASWTQTNKGSSAAAAPAEASS